MKTNEGYYGVTRTDEYLAHYGIKGMKWGVRKAIASGNSARLGRQYRKAQKKLAKLEARAANGKKYAKRAAALGAGAAAAGGLAVAGTTGVGTALTRAGNAAAAGGRGLGKAMATVGGSKLLRKSKAGAALRTAGYNLQNVAPGASQAAYGASRAVRKWGNTKSVQTIAGRQLEAQGKRNLQNAIKAGSTGKISANDLVRAGNVGKNEIARGKAMRYTNNQLLRAGAAAVGAGLGAGAAYNAYRAATTKRAAKKAAQFRSEMNKAFAGTQYGKKARQGKRRRG